MEFRRFIHSFGKALIALTLASAMLASPTSAAPKSASKPAAKTAKRAAKSAPPAPAASTADSESSQNRETNLPGWFKTVRIIDADTGAALGESSALAVDDRFLLLPWRFVSQIRTGHAKTRFVLAETSQEVRLIDADAFSGFALLKSHQFLHPSMPRTQIRPDVPAAGEHLVSLQASYLPYMKTRASRVQTDGTIQRLTIEGDSIENARTTFHFDRQGRLVAMSHSNEPAGIARAAGDLLRRHDGPRPAAVDHLDLKARQLSYWQDRQMQQLSPLRSLLSFKHLDCRLYSPSIADKRVAALVKNARGKSCETSLPLIVAGDYAMGAKFWNQEITLSNFAEDVGERITKAVSAEAFADHDKSSALVGLMTASDCRDNVVDNTQGKKVHVRFCTSALKVEPTYSDTVIVAGVIDSRNKAFVNVARLRGFNQANTKRIIEALVENFGVPQ